VRVGREGAANRQPIGAGLLLGNPPLPRAPALPLDERRHERRPLDAGVDLDGSALGIQRSDLVQRAQIDQQRVGPELLAAHRVPAAAKRDRRALRGRGADGGVDLVRGARRQDALDARLVQLGMEIVDDDRRLAVAVAGKRGHDQGAGRTKEGAARKEWLMGHAPLIGRCRPETAPGARTALHPLAQDFFTNLCRSGLTVSATQISPFGPMAM